MNERFWNLQKEKQDRMINAALKVFGENGYYRACTDEIVKEAGISKGLLFHYFISKLGLYEFICDYSIRYMKLELSGLVNHGKKEFWARCREIAALKAQIMRQYPYILLFLNVACAEKEETIGAELKEKLADYTEFVRALYPKPEKSDYLDGQNYDNYMKLAEYVECGAVRHALSGSETDQNEYDTETASLFRMLGELCHEGNT